MTYNVSDYLVGGFRLLVRGREIFTYRMKKKTQSAVTELFRRNNKELDIVTPFLSVDEENERYSKFHKVECLQKKKSKGKSTW